MDRGKLPLDYICQVSSLSNILITLGFLALAVSRNTNPNKTTHSWSNLMEAEDIALDFARISLRSSYRLYLQWKMFLSVYETSAGSTASILAQSRQMRHLTALAISDHISCHSIIVLSHLPGGLNCAWRAFNQEHL